MKTSNHTEALEARFGALGAVRMNCEAGFEAIDYSMYTRDGAVFQPGGSALTKEMKRIASSYGVGFNQAHAPFSRFKIGEENRDENRAIYYSIIRAMEVASELEAPIIVVHPSVICPYLSADDRFMMNMEFYEKLLPRAKNLGLKIAIENMWGRHKDCRERIVKDVCSDAAELIRYVDHFNSADVCACLDVGHAGLVGEAADEMAIALGKRVGCIHIHDNDFYKDKHSMPFTYGVNFDTLNKALAKIGYTGEVTLESNYFLDKFPDALVPPALTFMARTAAYLRDEILAMTEKRKSREI